MIQFVKRFTLPISILLGVVGYKIFWRFDFITPYLIFAMLFFTFSKVNYKHLKPSWTHLRLIFFQILISTAIFYLIKGYNMAVAQGIMICILCPTATAAAVITKRLNGSFEFVASYTLYINIAVAIYISLMFPLMGANGENFDFYILFIKIFSKIFPLLICPFLLAFAIRRLKKINNIIVKNSGIAFYIWSISLIIVVSRIAKDFIDGNGNETTTLMLSVGALISCLFQFLAGKLIGKKANLTIEAGQSLGQKNTIFAIWLANTYFSPIVAVGAGAYVIWQNLFNSAQIYYEERK
ncbi:MAG: transporter [Bacteroidales bacterium]|nr:MAG: transporter [Bacteroidales bacterium]